MKKLRTGISILLSLLLLCGMLVPGAAVFAETQYGTLTMDTVSYTMAPGDIYDFRAKVEGGDLRQDEVVVSDSRTGSIVKLARVPGTDKYRITAVNEGVCWVIAEARGTHASIRVEVKKGVKAHGESTRSITMIPIGTTGNTGNTTGQQTLQGTQEISISLDSESRDKVNSGDFLAGGVGYRDSLRVGTSPSDWKVSVTATYPLTYEKVGSEYYFEMDAEPAVDMKTIFTAEKDGSKKTCVVNVPAAPFRDSTNNYDDDEDEDEVDDNDRQEEQEKNPEPVKQNPAEEQPQEEPEEKKPEATQAELDALADEVFELTNEEREKAGLRPLNRRYDVDECAMIRAEEISEEFSYLRPNGRYADSVLDMQYTLTSENIARGQTSPEAVVNSWMNSAGYRSNILDSSFAGMGVGVYKTGGTYYWVQIFITDSDDVAQWEEEAEEEANRPADTDALADEIFELINDEREAAGLSPLKRSAQVEAGAQIRAKEIVGNLSHTRPNGEKYKTAVTGLHHYKSGENILRGSTSHSAEELVQSWMDSSGHRANILTADFELTGIGVYQDGRDIYCAQIFWTE